LEQRRDAYRLRRISLTARMQYAELTELAEAANLLILDEAAKEPALNSHFANPFRLQGRHAMRFSSFARYALCACVAAAMLAACSGSQPPIGAPLSASRASVTYNVLYSFKGGSDGEQPLGSLLDVNGTLYGTTWGGGHKGRTGRSLGTVFALTTSGAESVLHRFAGARQGDGANPRANLMDVNGTLYGTTSKGGTVQKEAWGTVFAISLSGDENVLYSFRGGAAGDGKLPTAGLARVGGTFYGTTNNGGNPSACQGGCGTVYSVTVNGSEKVLHSFGGSNDGRNPFAGLIDVDGTLYGTTGGGGANLKGTVFAITTSGKERVLHSFGGGSADGAGPLGALINVDGTLYGTTSDGGTKNGGTVFSISRTGKETVLYNFGPSGEAFPQGALTYVNGTLYGTTTAFNSYNGSIFSLTLDGKETVLHSFGGGTDGSDPEAGLINVNGTLYGTTAGGGANHGGTVFSLTP